MFGYLVFAAAFAMLVATYVYVRSMFRGGAKPNRVTWLMWSVAPFIATAAAVSNGVGWATLPVFMTGISPLIIFSASFFTRKAYWKLGKFDYACGALSGLALALWYVTKDPNVAISFAIASDALASAPTFAKAWRYPETESPWPYVVGIFNALSSFGAITLWTFSAYAFPVYLAVISVLLCLAVFNKKLVSLFRRI